MDEQRGINPWSSGTDYDLYVGRWSSLVAAQFVPWLDAVPGGSWLDAGCGTGALSEAVLRHAEPTRIHGIDTSEPYLDVARHRLSGTIATFELGDTMRLDDADDSHDAVVSALVLNFVPDAAAALAEQARVTAPGGVVGAYVWDYAEGMQLMRYFWDAVIERDESMRQFAEQYKYADWRPANIEQLFMDAGLTAVETRTITVPTPFHSVEDYWLPFLGGQGPAPAYLRTLDAGAVAELRQIVERRLPIEADGSIALTAGALATKGLKRWPLKRE